MLYQINFGLGSVMVTIHFITFIPIVTIFLMFLRYFIRERQKMLGYLSLLFVAYLINHTFKGFIFFAFSEDMAILLFKITQISQYTIYFSLIVILELFDKNSLFTYNQVVFLILSSLIIGALLTESNIIVNSTENLYIVTLERFNLITLLQFVFHILSSSVLIYILIRDWKEAKDKKQKALSFWIIIGVIFAVFLPLIPEVNFDFFILPDINPIFHLLRTLAGGIFQNLGMIIIGLAFLRVSKNPWLLQRQGTDLIIVYSHDGIELYTKVLSENYSDDDSILIAGAFSAISTLFQETTKASGKLEAILLEGKQLRIINKPHFISALLVEYTTEASETAHRNFCNDFEEKFKDDLENFYGETTKFKEANQLVTKYFN